jgi:predicted DsbA family dithiol-disulfide isomerase
MDVVHFTDPACPFAFSAEPQRLQLRWHYGDQLTWRTVMIGLHETAEAAAAKGLTPERVEPAMRMLQARHGMPIDVALRPRVPGTVPACRAVVAVRLHAPDAALEDAFIRRLRVRYMGGELLDEQVTIDAAAADVGIDAADLAAWVANPATEEALRDDMRAARTPHPSALVLDHKLSPSEDGGRRYSAPSYELRVGDDVAAAPGFQPWESYDVAIANLAPAVERRAPAADVAEVLAWADMPLATAEVAAIRGIEVDAARTELEQAGATYEAVGEDGYWSAA